jgi:hypothetical protein
MIGTEFLEMQQTEIAERHSPAEHLKSAQQLEIEQQKAAFFAGGGEVQMIAPGVVTGDPDLCDWTRGLKNVKAQ